MLECELHLIIYLIGTIVDTFILFIFEQTIIFKYNSYILTYIPTGYNI